jgi:hypothetical protein
MKKSIAVFIVVLFGTTACSQYTCPTYAKNEVKDIGIEQVIEDKQNI